MNDSSIDIPFEYEVIGEHLLNPLHLLTVDADGRLFDLNLETCTASPTELTEFWVVDTMAARRSPLRNTLLPSTPVLVVG